MKKIAIIILLLAGASCKKETQENYFNNYEWEVKVTPDVDSVNVAFIGVKMDTTFTTIGIKGAVFAYKSFSGKKEMPIIIYGQTTNATIQVLHNDEVKSSSTIAVNDSLITSVLIGK